MVHHYNERKRNERRVIKRKTKILRDIYGLDLNELGRGYHGHGLSKRKVHCSCPMCSEKTKYIGYKHSDKKKLEKIKEEIAAL